MPEQNHIVSAFIFELSKVETKAVRERMVGQLANVDPKIAQRVAKGLGLQGEIKKVPTTVAAREDLPESPALSILKKAHASLEGKLVGALIADGSDPAVVMALKKAVSKAGGSLKVIAPKIGGAITSDGQTIEADFQLAGGPSVLFDAIFVVLSKEGGSMLMKEAAAIAFCADAFAHLKVIGATPGARALLDKAGVMAGDGVLAIADGGPVDEYVARAAKGRVWEREPSVRTVY